MKKYIYFLMPVLFSAILFSCQKDTQTAFKSFLGNEELIYTGAVGKVIVQPGNLSIGLKWKASTDPSIIKYVIYYNNNADSTVVPNDAEIDTVRAVINNLLEYTYAFTIYSFDAKGNKSIPTEVNNAKVYGPIYEGSLLNRPYDPLNPYIYDLDNGSLTLNFIEPDTINTNTIIKYINAAGLSAEATIAPSDNSVILPSYKPGTEITYKSSYIPDKNSIDIFSVSHFDTFPAIAILVPCDKSLFKDDAPLPNDVQAAYGTTLSKLWDGSIGPQPYPNIFHSDENHGMPHTFTFDMGKSYLNLAQVEETGRNSDHNPAEFEVWGRADIANSATTLQANDGGWKAEMVAKGWILLGDCVRNDDGKQPVKFKLTANQHEVRYIRIRVKRTVNNNQNASNWAELTFWDQQ